ncbi:MAG: phosphatidylglycerophosphatase A [Bryobacterales bacterium]|nr:phosphatidylglycerophosphatase A [Bryobacterales bacterium]
MTRAAQLLAVWFGCGWAPKAPGTAGSLGALAVAWPLAAYAGWAPWHFAVLAGAMTLPAIWAAGVEARTSGRKDPGQVVVDEVVGQWVALAGVRDFGWKNWLAAFLLFRLFDIVKPSPVRQLEALPGGTGIVADDLMAGAYAALVLILMGWFNLY